MITLVNWYVGCYVLVVVAPCRHPRCGVRVLQVWRRGRLLPQYEALRFMINLRAKVSSATLPGPGPQDDTTAVHSKATESDLSIKRVRA